jgi:Fe2+ or Zn2+ uptake regulation protein
MSLLTKEQLSQADQEITQIRHQVAESLIRHQESDRNSFIYRLLKSVSDRERKRARGTVYHAVLAARARQNRPI